MNHDIISLYTYTHTHTHKRIVYWYSVYISSLGTQIPIPEVQIIRTTLALAKVYIRIYMYKKKNMFMRMYIS